MTLQTQQAQRIFDTDTAGQFPDEPLVLLDFGFEKKPKEYCTVTITNQNCRRYLFVYTFRGKGTCVTEEETCSLLPRTAFLQLLPQESHYRTSEDSAEDEWEFFYMYFQGDAALPFYQKITEDFGRQFSLHSNYPPTQSWASVQRNFTQGRPLLPYEGGELVYRFLSWLLRTLETEEMPNRSYVELGITYMQKHLSSNFSIETLAGSLGVSPSYFTRLFVKEMGVSPINYLTELRISHAAFLLENTSLPVEVIAKECGFSCGNYFCKAFRKTLDYSPLEYRRQAMGVHIRESRIPRKKYNDEN